MTKYLGSYEFLKDSDFINQDLMTDSLDKGGRVLAQSRTVMSRAGTREGGGHIRVGGVVRVRGVGMSFTDGDDLLGSEVPPSTKGDSMVKRSVESGHQA